MDKLTALKFFIATADSGSFSSAAKQFGSDPSTLSKAVRRLETELGVLLFHRTTRSLALTEAGHQYLSTAKTVIDNLSNAEYELTDSRNEPRGTLRINAPVTYGRRYLVPAIQSFRQQYPQVNFDLQFDDTHVDIIDNRFDLAIRSGTLKDSRLIARQLSPLDFVICASTELALTLPKDFAPAHFHTVPWLRYRFKQTGKLMPILARQAERELELDCNADLICDDGESMLELCLEGAGLCQLPHFALRKPYEAGRLIPLFPSCTLSHFGIHIIYPKRDYLPTKTRLFVEHMLAFVQSRGESAQSTWARHLTSQYQWPVSLTASHS